MTSKPVRRKVEDTENTTLTVQATREAIDRLRGSFKGRGLLKALLEERAKDREREDAKWVRIRQKDEL
jgi:hypothetical protein